MEFDKLIDGIYADEYCSPKVKQKIIQKYQQRFIDPGITPHTHPWSFDPLNPPTGWRYDPYYEIWLTTKETK